VSELRAGELSSYRPTQSGAFVALVEKIIPATDEEVKKELPQYVQDLRRRSAAEAFNDWFATEMQLAQLSIPGDGLEKETATQ
jgi:hypothetical protein